MPRERYSGQEVAAGRYSEVDDAVKESSGERLEKRVLLSRTDVYELLDMRD
jgi:hypothetical protein